MKLQNVVKKLDTQFKKDTIKDDWNFMRDGYPKDWTGNMVGLVLDFSEEIEKIYTTCFPSKYVLKNIFDREEENVLLISHHPFDWEPYHAEKSFLPWDEEDVKIMKERNISFYAAHLMWDNAKCECPGLISTTSGFPKKIGMEIEKLFLQDPVTNPNLWCCAVGTHKLKTLENLTNHIYSVTKHSINLIKNNDKPVEKIGYIPGGGNHAEYVQAAGDIDTFITGCTRMISNYQKTVMPAFYDYLKENEINLIGAGHYATEKWAPLMSLPYFSQFGKAEFIDDLPKNSLLD